MRKKYGRSLSNEAPGLITALPPSDYRGTKKAWIIALERLGVIKYNPFWRRYPGWALNERIEKKDICIPRKQWLSVLDLAESLDDYGRTHKDI